MPRPPGVKPDFDAESGGIKGVVVTDVLDRVVAESARHELVTALENLRRLSSRHGP